jgi:hypothetical protein
LLRLNQRPTQGQAYPAFATDWNEAVPLPGIHFFQNRQATGHVSSFLNVEKEQSDGQFPASFEVSIFFYIVVTEK